MADRQTVIVEAVRTPIGRRHPEKGCYKNTHASGLLATCGKEMGLVTICCTGGLGTGNLIQRI